MRRKKDIKRIIPLTILLYFFGGVSYGCQAATPDSSFFKGIYSNEEYDVYININFYDKDIIVPYQELLGFVDGYFGDRHDSRKWLFVDSRLATPVIAMSDIINDYGSEDLTVSLTAVNDTMIVLRQIKGSTLRIARDRKWVKMPKELTFIKKR